MPKTRQNRLKRKQSGKTSDRRQRGKHIILRFPHIEIMAIPSIAPCRLSEHIHGVAIHRCRTIASDTQFVTGVLQLPGCEHLTAEIRQIDALTGNGLVHVMQLAQRKPLAYQSGDDLRIFDFAAKSAEGSPRCRHGQMPTQADHPQETI